MGDAAALETRYLWLRRWRGASVRTGATHRTALQGTLDLTTQSIDPVYTTSVVVAGGRQGKAVSDDGVLDLKLGAPGATSGEPATNPEQLFAAGYAACFQSALMSAAREDGKDASASTVTAEVSLGKVESGSFGLAVALTVSIPDMNHDAVQALANAAHQRCPYSRATRGNIDVQVRAA